MTPFPRRRRLALLLTAAALALAIGLAGPARDAAAVPPPNRAEGNVPARYVPELMQKAREAARVDEKLDFQLPLDLELTDSSGRTVRLGDYFAGKRPVVIQMAYYRCPQLCGEIAQGMIRSMRSLGEELTIGEDFEVLTISFDTRETAALANANKEATVQVLSRTWPEQNVRDGWQFMVGSDASITRLTDALGYRFGWIEEAQQYSHPAAVVICTPDGRVARYLYGVGYDPQALRLSLISASQGTITPSLKDAFVMSCFAYDPQTGKYTPVATKIMRLAGATTVVALVAAVGFMLVVERRGKLRRHPMAGTPAPEGAFAAEDDAAGDEAGGDGDGRHTRRGAFQ